VLFLNVKTRIGNRKKGPFPSLKFSEKAKNEVGGREKEIAFRSQAKAIFYPV